MTEESPNEVPLTILVVDDHAITREAVASIARGAGHDVHEASSGEHAVRIASSVRPDLVIMDVLMPGMSGIEATERIVAHDARARVLILSAADAADTVRAAMNAGAAGYLTKTAATRATLLDALRRTAAGEKIFVPSALADALIHGPGIARSQKTQLTGREKEIVTLAAQGAASSDIADALGLSPRTVDNHLLRVYRKLGISGRAQLARIAVDQQAGRYSWAGQACTIMLADIVSFAAPDRDTREQLALRESLYEILREAFTRSGIPWSAIQVSDRGDGVLVVVPPGVPTGTVIDPCLKSIASGLRRHNAIGAEAMSMRLRVAVAAGPVTADTMGLSGEAIILASRLAGAPPFREEARASGAELSVIVSQSVYKTVIVPGDLGLNPADMRSVDVGVKELTTIAWAWFSDEPTRPSGPRETGDIKGRLGPLRHRQRSPSALTGTRTLYGRTDAFSLVRNFLTRAEKDHRADHYADPVLLFEGPRGTGKTALLKALAEQFDQQFPCASLDCEGFVGDTRTLPALVAFEFGRRSGRRRTLRFPRLVTAQIAISAPLETAVRLEDAHREIQRRLELYQRSNIELRDMVTSGLTAALESVPAWSNERPAVADTVASQGARLILGGSLSTPRGRRILLREGLNWYGHQDRGLGRHPLDLLVDLNRMAASPHGAAEHAVTELLWAAFLADLRNSGRKNQPVHCLLLLDNADAAAGGRILDGLLAARRLSSTAGPDPITVIATSRGALSERLQATARVPLRAAIYDADYRRDQNRRAHPLYPVDLPDLTWDQTRLMVAEATLGSNAGAVTDTVYRFTAGHPGSTRILCDAIAEHPDNAPDLPALLDANAADNLSVEELMLSQFLAGIPTTAIEDLITCSAARDREAARRMAATSGLMIYAGDPYAAALSEDLWWKTAPDSQAKLPPVLRRLLLRRLSRRDDTAPASWNRVFGALADQCVEAREDIGAMYYSLARGDIQRVASEFTSSLERLNASDWLQLLKSVAAAPNRLDHHQPFHHQLSALTEWGDPSEQPLASIARFIAASWIRSDPLSASHRTELSRQMAHYLEAIAIHQEASQPAFRSAIERYTRAADGGIEAALD